MDAPNVFIIDTRYANMFWKVPLPGACCNCAHSMQKERILCALSDGTATIGSFMNIVGRNTHSRGRQEEDQLETAWSYNTGSPDLLHAICPKPDENQLVLSSSKQVDVVQFRYK